MNLNVYKLKLNCMQQIFSNYKFPKANKYTSNYKNNFKKKKLNTS